MRSTETIYYLKDGKGGLQWSPKCGHYSAGSIRQQHAILNIKDCSAFGWKSKIRHGTRCDCADWLKKKGSWLYAGLLLTRHELVLSHGLIVSGDIFWDAPTDLRLPDLGRNQKMMLSSCCLHMLCAKHG